MATTIKSSALDFNAIKNNLKTYLANKDEFADYNFEASGLSNILDVLAYNTHMNALVANFALNESYLSTAQLRSSVVSLSENVGYIPDTPTAAVATVRINFSTTASIPDTVTLPAYTKFTGEVDGVTYTFQTIEAYNASNDGTGFYEFQTSDGVNRIPLYEGTQKTKSFIVGEYEDNPVYVIPDSTLDAATVAVRVYENAPYSDFQTYQNILNTATISANSTIYTLREAPNGYYELGFGDGVAFGIAPPTGSKIEVVYLSTAGAAANGARTFAPAATFTVNSVTINLRTVTINSSVGGDERESIERIRLRAPFQYASQNRMVTAEDYTSLILKQKNYSTFISDIISWGGEDDLNPEFGAVNVCILFEPGVTLEQQASIKLGILDLAEQLSIVSFKIRFVDPTITYVESDVFFQFNPRLTDTTINTMENRVAAVVSGYFGAAVGGFDKSFRRSNMLTLVDDVSNAVLSSRANIRVQQRFTPSAPNLIDVINAITNYTIENNNTMLDYIVDLVSSYRFKDAANYIITNSLTDKNYTYVLDKLTNTAVSNSQQLLFPVPLAVPDDDTYTVSSNNFIFRGTTCTIKNKLGSSTLQIVDLQGVVIVDNIGNYQPTLGIVTINYFNPSRILGNIPAIKLAVTPANQSAVTPKRGNLLRFDRGASRITAVTVDANN